MRLRISPLGNDGTPRVSHPHCRDGVVCSPCSSCSVSNNHRTDIAKPLECRQRPDSAMVGPHQNIRRVKVFTWPGRPHSHRITKDLDLTGLNGTVLMGTIETNGSAFLWHGAYTSSASVLYSCIYPNGSRSAACCGRASSGRSGQCTVPVQSTQRATLCRGM